jgi:hypothetical protein
MVEKKRQAEAARMRGAILSMAVLSTAVLAAAATTQAQAGTPVGGFKPPPARVSFTPRPMVSRPIVTPSVMPRPAMPVARTPHCPKPPAHKPISVSIPKAPNYNKRAMALVQQNIIMMSVMRSAQTSVPRCKSTWSEAKLRRKGCSVATPTELAPEALPMRDLPRMQIAADTYLPASTPDGADRDVVQAAPGGASGEGSGSQN